MVYTQYYQFIILLGVIVRTALKPQTLFIQYIYLKNCIYKSSMNWIVHFETYNWKSHCCFIKDRRIVYSVDIVMTSKILNLISTERKSYFFPNYSYLLFFLFSFCTQEGEKNTFYQELYFRALRFQTKY